MRKDLLDYYAERYGDHDILKADGFDDAVIGIDESVEPLRLVYSVKKVIKNIMSDGASREDAYEHFEFNLAGSYMGPGTPIWCHDDY